MENGWRGVFAEEYPEPGASAEELAGLVAEAGCSLPASYLSFLGWSNGGEFRNGERWFQFFQALHPSQGVHAMQLAYGVPRYMPGALPFAFNGGGAFYLFDTRFGLAADEYPVVIARAGNLGWAPDECFPVAPSFLAAGQGTVPLL